MSAEGPGHRRSEFGAAVLGAVRRFGRDVARELARLAGPGGWRSRRGRLLLASGCVVLLAFAATLFLAFAGDQVHAPQPPAAAAVPSYPAASTMGPQTSTAPTTTAAGSTPKPQPSSTEPVPAGSGSTPVQIRIPAIHVVSDLMQLGLNADRTVQVPPLSDVGEAGWYKYSPIPGQTGPAVILGHIDSAQYGDGVFFDLGDLRQGDSVTVLRADDLNATFAVTRVVEVSKSAFPTNEVYGNTPDPELRLITCGGRFDASTGSYVDNIVVFASLTGLTRR